MVGQNEKRTHLRNVLEPFDRKSATVAFPQRSGQPTTESAEPRHLRAFVSACVDLATRAKPIMVLRDYALRTDARLKLNDWTVACADGSFGNRSLQSLFPELRRTLGELYREDRSVFSFDLECM